MIFCTRWVVYATHRVLLLFQKSRKGTVLRYFLFLRKVPKGFSFVCVKPLLRRAESRFAEPRSFFKKGFNFVRAKVLFGWADSRFAKPRSSRQGSTDWYFLRRAKSNQKARSDVQKVACGKFLCVGDRRNRENCERT